MGSACPKCDSFDAQDDSTAICHKHKTAAPELPDLKWIKNDPAVHQLFEDGSVFLTALRVLNNKTGIERWEYDKIAVVCDEDRFDLVQYGCGCAYSGWSWDDFEYFIVLEGMTPKVNNEQTEE